MSTGKFASITPSILARKGEAKPWQDPDEESAGWHNRPPEQIFSLRHTDVNKPVQPPVIRSDEIQATMQQEKKYSLRMSFQEYEKLGILAVKKDSTRQQLLREALAQLFTALANDNSCVNGVAMKSMT
jgi:hypothetical protein